MGLVISTLLFQPPRPASYSENDSRIVWLECRGKGAKDPRTGKEVPVQIPSVYLSYKGSDLVLLHSHGNATDLGQMLPYLELLRSSLKINVFSYEYQGYGLSRPKVKCTEQRIYDSIEAAVDYLINVKGHRRSNIIVFGTSLGSGPSIYITNKYSRFNRGNNVSLSSSSSKRSSSPVSSSKRSSTPTSSSSTKEENEQVNTTRRKSNSSFKSKKALSADHTRNLANKNEFSLSDDISANSPEIVGAEDDYDSFRGLILQSAFTSVIRIKFRQPMKFLDMFSNIDKIDKVDCPVFIVHGKVDEVVPFEHALTLKDKVLRPYKPLYIDYAGHNNIMDILSVERYVKKIYEFIIYLNQDEQKREKKRRELRDDSITVESPAPISRINGRRLMNASTDSNISDVRTHSFVDVMDR